MPTWTEVLGNRAKSGEKPLGVSRGLEPLHASLPLAGRLVGILRAVIQGAVLSGLDAGQQLAFCRTVALQFRGALYSSDGIVAARKIRANTTVESKRPETAEAAAGCLL